jgi:O-antigen ligase
MCVSYTKWEQRIGALALLSMLLGVYASGSRGGAVCAVGAVVLVFALLPRTRPHVPGILLVGVALAGIVAVVIPSLGTQILRVTRLAGNPTTSGSDLVRAQVGAQGIADFHHSPLFGIGLQASTDASQVYIQELAAGGLLLFVAMSVYMLGGAWAALRHIDRNPLAAAILGSIGATLALNVFEADLTDRFYYVPEAILIAMLTIARQDREAAAERLAEPADAVPDERVGAQT